MSTLKTIDIKGKDYVLINERVKYFNETYKTGQIITTLLSNQNGICVFKAEVIIDGVVKSTGHAYENETNGFINKTSYIENCETSAVGRALGFAGIGIDTSIASYEEVANAVLNQNKKPVETMPITEGQKQTIEFLVESGKADLEGLLEYYKVAELSELTFSQAQEVIVKKNKEKGK